MGVPARDEAELLLPAFSAALPAAAEAVNNETRLGGFGGKLGANLADDFVLLLTEGGQGNGCCAVTVITVPLAPPFDPVDIAEYGRFGGIDLIGNVS